MSNALQHGDNTVPNAPRSQTIIISDLTLHHTFCRWNPSQRWLYYAAIYNDTDDNTVPNTPRSQTIIISDLTLHHTFCRWNPSQRWLYYAATLQRHWILLVYDMATGCCCRELVVLALRRLPLAVSSSKLAPRAFLLYGKRSCGFADSSTSGTVARTSCTRGAAPGV